MKRDEVTVVLDQYGNVDVEFYLRKAHQLRSNYITDRLSSIWCSSKKSVKDSITAPVRSPKAAA